MLPGRLRQLRVFGVDVVKVNVTHDGVEVDGFLFDVDVENFEPSTFGRILS